MSTYDNSAINVYSKQKYYNVSVTHLPSNNTVSFPAFLTDYKDTFKNEYEVQSSIGQVSPIYLHKFTSRSITVSIQLVSDGITQAKNNFFKLKMLSLFMYPSRTPVSPASATSQYFGITTLNNSVLSLIKIKFANLIGSGIKSDGPGLNGYVNGVSISPVVENGFFEARGAIYPKTYNLTLSLEVVHAEPPNLQVPNSNPSAAASTTSPPPTAPPTPTPPTNPQPTPTTSNGSTGSPTGGQASPPFSTTNSPL